LVPLLDDPVELRLLSLRFCTRRGRLRARRYRLGSQIGAEQSKVHHLGTLLREARSSPGKRGPQGLQRALDIDLAADERRLGGAPIRQILREGNGASRKAPWSRKRKGMPETVTWKILGTSLQKTSSDDRSDPTVASAHSRSSSQDWSSRSSSRTKPGSEASRVRNRSNWRRPSELHRTATRLPPGGTDRASTPPLFRGTERRRLRRLDVGSGRSLPDWDGGDFSSDRCRHRRHVRWARGHVRVSRHPHHDGHPSRSASLGNPLHGDWCRLSPLLWSALREGHLNGKARSGAGHASRCRLKGLPGRQVSQPMASLAEEKRKITVATYE
jgi:hypothetical protein